MSICDRRKEIRYGNGSVYRVGQNKTTPDALLGALSVMVFEYEWLVYYIDINDIHIWMDGRTYLRINVFISLWCVLKQIDGTFGISPLSYGAWHNHNVCVTQTSFSLTCKDGESSLVLVNKTGKGTIKFPVLVISHTQQYHYHFVVSVDQDRHAGSLFAISKLRLLSLCTEVSKSYWEGLTDNDSHR